MARLDHCPDAEPRRGENVALRAVRVMEQGDARRAVRVVLDRCDLRRHAILQALEVDDAVAPLVPAALVARRDPAVVVPAALLAQLGRERLVGLGLRDLLERGDGHETAARARRFVTTDRHRLNLCSLEDFDRVAGLQLDDCLLPARPPAADHPSALRFRLHLGDVHAHDLDVEELFDRLAHLGLVRVRMDAERVRVPALDLCVALLRDHGRQQDFVWMQAHQDAFAFTRSSASSVTSTERAHTSAATSSSPGLTTTTRSRFRNDLATFCSSFVTTTSGSSWPHSASRSAAVENAEGAVRSVLGEHTAESGAARLPIDLDLEVSRGRREGDTAAGPVRGARRAGAGTAGALLAPRLCPSTGHKAAALGRARAGAPVIHLRAHGLVDDVQLQLRAEDVFLERDVLRLLAGGVEQRCFRRCHLVSSRTSTKAFFGPGTAPLTSSRLRSASISCTTRPTCVTRLPPIRPDIFMPLKTRAGVADAPIEPGLRMLCEPCDLGPRRKLCRLIVPAKPLPWEIPLTLIFSPGSKTSTVTFSPTMSPLCPRSSSKLR